jgi:hypothetical protein
MTALTLGRGEDSCWLATSTTREWWRRKSTPRIGKLTATRRKVHWRGRPLMVTVKGCSPQQGMRRPSAPDNPGPKGGDKDRHGIIEKAEPVSTRYRRLDELSVTKKRRPGRITETTPRRPSFPARRTPPRRTWPARQTWRGNNTWTCAGRPPAPGLSC